MPNNAIGFVYSEDTPFISPTFNDFKVLLAQCATLVKFAENQFGISSSHEYNYKALSQRTLQGLYMKYLFIPIVE